MPSLAILSIRGVGIIPPYVPKVPQPTLSTRINTMFGFTSLLSEFITSCAQCVSVVAERLGQAGLLLEAFQSHAEVQTVLITLELVDRGVFMKVMKVERDHLLRQSSANLYSCRIHMVKYSAVRRSGAAVVC